MFDVYCRIKRIEKDSIYLLYNGNAIENFEVTLDELVGAQIIYDNIITILVYHRLNSVFIVFSHLGHSCKVKKDIEEKLESVYSDYLTKNEIDGNEVFLRYNNKSVDLELTINQFITKNNIHNINFGNMDEKDENLIEIKFDVIDIKEASKLICFSYQNKKYEYRYTLEKNMRDIFNEYAKEIKINRNKLEFKYNGIPIEEDQTLNKFINEKMYAENLNLTQYNIKANEINENKKNEPIINIDVIDLSCPYYFFSTYKLPIIIVIGIIILIIAIILIILFVKKNNNHSSTIKNNIIIPNDYLINATYLSTESEIVKLISDKFDLNKIKNMSIDGNITNPIKSYIFNEKGKHIVYYSFNQITDESLLSEGSGIFNGIINLIDVKFSNYSENYPDVSFQGMFNNCINLLSADFSQMKSYIDFYYEYFGNDIYSYYYSMNYMFNNCTSLTSINFNLNKENDNIVIVSSKYMFNNCKSLTELYLS